MLEISSIQEIISYVEVAVRFRFDFWFISYVDNLLKPQSFYLYAGRPKSRATLQWQLNAIWFDIYW